jgi:hypothetical protein
VSPVPVALDIADRDPAAFRSTQRPHFRRTDSIRGRMQVALRRFEVTAAALRFAEDRRRYGRGATNAFQIGPFLFNSWAIFGASLLRFGTT